MRRTIMLAALVLPLAAHAQPVRDVPYFINNPAEAKATVQACRNNAAYAKLPTCKNAERALSMSDVQQLVERYKAGAAEGQAMLYDPNPAEPEPKRL
jgi:hypothetical protein